MSILFNSLDTFYKYPKGPIKESEIGIFRIKLPKNLAPYNVQITFFEYCADWKSFTFFMEIEEEFSDNNYICFKCEISDFEINIYQYYFSFTSFGNKKYLKKSVDSWEAYISDVANGSTWQLTVYTPVTTHPNMKSGIMYQIFPDRFYNSGKTTNLPTDRIYRSWDEIPYFSDDTIGLDFFGGDLKGITEKLNYLHSLGVTVLYLNPIWESQSNHRYNTANYKVVDPVLGNFDDLLKLISKAHLLGMLVILDTVLNHTGSDSIYFNKENRYLNTGAYRNPKSIFYDWYKFHANGSYDSWWGFDTLPTVNQFSESYINYFFGKGGILDTWYDMGIDGIRLDVADELENETLKRIFEASKRNRDFLIIIGEVWENASNKCNYGHRMEYFLGKELTSVMNYPVKDAILAYIRYGNNNDNWAKVLKNTLITIYIEDYPKEVSYSLMNFLSSHDTVRALTKLVGKEVDNNSKQWQFENDSLNTEELILGKKRLKLSYLLLYFLPGIPCIFYGDEIGMYGMKDPFCRKCFEWDNIDKNLLSFFTNLALLRKTYSKFLSDANFNIIEITNDLCIISRYHDNNTLYIFINRTNYTIDICKYTCNLINPTLIFSIYENANLHHLMPYNGIVIKF